MERAEEFVHYNNLFDIYGNLLNEREKEIFNLFYKEDLSLQEIALERNVSKSAIGSAIKIINKKLDEYENKLNFYEKEKQYLKKIEMLEKSNKNVKI